MTQPDAASAERAPVGCPGLPARVHEFAWSATLLLTLALVWVTQVWRGQNVWEGWDASSGLRRPIYAELVRVNDVFRTPVNTWSNLGFVLVGFYGLALGWHDLRHAAQRGGPYLARTPAMSLAFGLACCCLGAASGLFHASLSRRGQHLDVAAMYPPLLILIALNIGRWIPQLNFDGGRRKLPTWPALLILVGVASVLLYHFKWSMSAMTVLCTLIVTLVLFAMLDRFQTARKLNVRWLAASVVALCVAVVCRQLDIAGKFTGSEAWLQGHALWHILTSMSLSCSYFYYRSEVTTTPEPAA